MLPLTFPGKHLSCPKHPGCHFYHQLQTLMTPRGLLPSQHTPARPTRSLKTGLGVRDCPLTETSAPRKTSRDSMARYSARQPLNTGPNPNHHQMQTLISTSKPNPDLRQNLPQLRGEPLTLARVDPYPSPHPDPPYKTQTWKNKN